MVLFSMASYVLKPDNDVDGVLTILGLPPPAGIVTQECWQMRSNFMIIPPSTSFSKDLYPLPDHYNTSRQSFLNLNCIKK